MDVPKIIEEAGGVVNLANLLGVARTTVLGWSKDGFIPGNRVGQISSALGIKPEELLPLVEAPKPRAPKVA